MAGLAPAGGILELALLEDVEAITERYVARFGCPPVNLSHWDQSADLKRRLPMRLPPLEDLSAIDYAFSYTEPDRCEVLRRLGFDTNDWGGLLTHSGSSAIVVVAHWLKATGHGRIVILGPRYFTAPHAFAALELPAITLHCERNADGYHLPTELERSLTPGDAVWVTSPIYCTSLDYSPRDLARLQEIAASGTTIVIDECLSEPGRRLAPAFNPRHSVVGIFAPHKAVCINGVKFAGLAFPAPWQGFFDAWSDVWLGCLPFSSILGVRHFLSSDYTRYCGAFKAEYRAARTRVASIVRLFPNLEIDPSAEGYLISVYAPDLPARSGLDSSFLEAAAIASGSTFIAGLRNELDPAAGLSFRVNLAAFDVAAEGALLRLCAFLEEAVETSWPPRSEPR